MEDQIKSRTKKIGVEIIRLTDELSQIYSSRSITKQLMRSGTAIGANYRSACRARSAPDFINKLKIVEEEADETLYWLELLEEGGYTKNSRIQSQKKRSMRFFPSWFHRLKH